MLANPQSIDTNLERHFCCSAIEADVVEELSRSMSDTHIFLKQAQTRTHWQIEHLNRHFKISRSKD